MKNTMIFAKKIRSGNYTHEDVMDMLCWFDIANEKETMLTLERNNAEKREYEVLGRANALEAELKATQARFDASEELLREEFAQRQDVLATLLDIGNFAHDRSTGPAVEDALWEVRCMAYQT